MAQIFKAAETLDLGCSVGGGKNSKDIFKVGHRATKITLIDIDEENYWVTGAKTTLLDGKQGSGTLKRKYISFMNDIASVFPAPPGLLPSSEAFFVPYVTVS